jgi:uncharacterized RDD family membrane protein YckC
MKCPKCGYIGFEQTDRCRNCGYDFVLTTSTPREADLPLRGNDAAAPFDDFDLGSSAGTPGEAGKAPRRRYAPDLDARLTPQRGGTDLPLFETASAEELPVIPTAAPTPPLAVRRSTPPAVRARPRPSPRTIGLPDTRLPLADVPRPEGPSGEADERETDAGSLGARVSAGVVDGLLLLAADGVVVYFTLKICRLDLSQWAALPLAPLVAFLVLLNGGYLAMLTAAGGQTLGKMAFGLKVIGARDGSVGVGRSIARSLLLLAGTLSAGLGLLPVLFTPGRRGLHDLLGGTRVVRA